MWKSVVFTQFFTPLPWMAHLVGFLYIWAAKSNPLGGFILWGGYCSLSSRSGNLSVVYTSCSLVCSLSKSILHCYNIDIVLSGVFFGRMAVDAVEHLDDDMDLSLIGIKKVQGGSLAVCWFVFFPVIITDVFWSSGWSSKFTLLGVSECFFWIQVN